jgi:hypothetical protein
MTSTRNATVAAPADHWSLLLELTRPEYAGDGEDTQDFHSLSHFSASEREAVAVWFHMLGIEGLVVSIPSSWSPGVGDDEVLFTVTAAGWKRAERLRQQRIVEAVTSGRGAGPPRLITATVAASRYHVTSRTIRRAVKSGRLKDHRAPDHKDNAPVVVDEADVARHWLKR